MALEQADFGRTQQSGCRFLTSDLNLRVKGEPQGRAIAEPDFEAVSVAGFEAVAETNGG
ncbi:MAG: hypothetical protein M5U12_07815 [Verrucomicrobia bacterium]|nr:hypothetical protein [Verrucomicrobiota bacterium]